MRPSRYCRCPPKQGRTGQNFKPWVESSFRCIHHIPSEPSTASWRPASASLRLLGACCSQPRASSTAEPQRFIPCLGHWTELPRRCSFVHSSMPLRGAPCVAFLPCVCSPLG